jgi:hypothetical protein
MCDDVVRALVLQNREAEVLHVEEKSDGYEVLSDLLHSVRKINAKC